MLRNGISKRFLLIFTISLVTWHLSHAQNVQQHSSSYCSKQLNDTGYVLVPDETNNKDNQEYQFYEFAYQLKVLNEKCKISDTQGLVIGFERITRVSDILVEETAFGENLNAIKVSLRRGASTIECKFSPGNIATLSNSRFANFSCILGNDAYRSSGQPANAIEITSTTSEVSVNLANLIKEGSLGWLIVAQPTSTENTNADFGTCLPPGLYPGQTLQPEKQLYLLGDNVKFVCPDGTYLAESHDAQRTCQSNGKWSDNTPECLPKRQWWESIKVVSFDQIGELHNRAFPEFARKENVSNVAYFNQNFHSITEISIDFAVEFDSDEWKRRFVDDNNAIFHIADSNNNILKKGALPLRNPNNTTWDSITVSHENFVQSPCNNCSIGVTFRRYHWQVPIVNKIRVFGSTFSQGADADKNGKTQCPPITPYYGMPDTFKSYELVADGSINDQLLTSPCREGFKHVGKPSEINQCRGGTWQGSGFPNCEAIRVKSPPEVEHASWVYIQSNGQHETIYICESGYHATGRGKATYSIEHDEWIDVPECRQASLSDNIRDNWPILLAAGLIAVGLVCAACFLYKCIVLRYKILRRRERDRSILNSSICRRAYSWQTSTTLDDHEYVEPINKPLERPDLVRPSIFSRNSVEHVYDEPPA